MITGTAAIGLGILIVGFAYDLFFAGIPYQDVTPELQARWELNRSIADMAYVIGGITLLIGIVAIPVIGLVTGKGKRQSMTLP